MSLLIPVVVTITYVSPLHRAYKTILHTGNKEVDRNYSIYSLISRTFCTWNMACISPVPYMRNIPRGTKFSISNILDGTEDDILWTDVRDDTHDIDEEDDTYGDLTYL